MRERNFPLYCNINKYDSVFSITKPTSKKNIFYKICQSKVIRSEMQYKYVQKERKEFNQ